MISVPNKARTNLNVPVCCGFKWICLVSFLILVLGRRGSDFVCLTTILFSNVSLLPI